MNNAQNYPRFTTEMKETHTILIPQMAPIHFYMIAEVFRQAGYRIEVLENGGPDVAQEGLKYVHNDTCYPALLVIGQFLNALKSGRYDPERTALLITQTGGGCRASNYIHLLRKALVQAGFPQVPVASLNFSGLEKDSGFKMSLSVICKLVAACLYGDELMSLANQLRPYEDENGSVDACVRHWQDAICVQMAAGKAVSKRDMKRNFEKIAADFADISVTKVPKVKVGIVGEIYVKYSPLGNSGLEAFLAREDCEVNMPGLTAFIQYCAENMAEDVRRYGGNHVYRTVVETVTNFIAARERLMHDAVAKFSQKLQAPTLFRDVMKLGEGIVGRGAKMGEGWLLTSEMVELVHAGYPNIVCAQPFGCLPNHVVGKAMISKIRSLHPQANIVPIDYDPSATLVNQENRIKLMLAVAKERLEGIDHAVHIVKQAPQLPKATRTMA